MSGDRAQRERLSSVNDGPPPPYSPGPRPGSGTGTEVIFPGRPAAATATAPRIPPTSLDTALARAYRYGPSQEQIRADRLRLPPPPPAIATRPPSQRREDLPRTFLEGEIPCSTDKETITTTRYMENGDIIITRKVTALEVFKFKAARDASRQ